MAALCKTRSSELIHSEAVALIKEYKKVCGTHCTPHILIVENKFQEPDWGDDNLSNYVNSEVKALGCISCDFHSHSEEEGAFLLRKMLGESLLLEYAPFAKSTEEHLDDFIARLMALMGPCIYLSNVNIYGENCYGYKDVFPESEQYETDMGVALISENWFAFIAHRGFD